MLAVTFSNFIHWYLGQTAYLNSLEMFLSANLLHQTLQLSHVNIYIICQWAYFSLIPIKMVIGDTFFIQCPLVECFSAWEYGKINAFIIHVFPKIS